MKSYRVILPVICGILLTACGGQAEPTAELPTQVVIAEGTTDSGAVATEEVPLEDLFGNQPTIDPNLAFTEFPILSTLGYDKITNEPLPTERPTIEGELVYGDPRTLVTSKTEDPDVGIPFTSIRMERKMGSADQNPLVIEILGTGTIRRNDVEGAISQVSLDSLNALLLEIGFYGISGDYLGVLPPDGTENFLYYIQVERNGMTSSINTQDGYMPPEITTLIARILEEGDRIR